MPVTRRSQTPIARHGRPLVVAALTLAVAAPLFAQAPPPIDVIHPGGVMRLRVADAQIYNTDATHFWTRPAGRFQFLTGPTAPRGGDPTRSGDEDRAVGGQVYASVNAAPAFTNRFTVSMDNMGTGTTGKFFDIHNLMEAQGTQATAAALENFWPIPLVAGTRDVSGTARIPVDTALPSTATEFLLVKHTFTMIHDMVKAEYIITNQTLTSHTIGARILIDPTFGGASGRDGKPIYLPDGTTVDNEAVIPGTTFPGLSIPDHWVSADNPNNPLVVLKGLINAPDIASTGTATSSAGVPDEVQFGQARNIAIDNQYNFTPNTSASLIGEDWAYATKWNEQTLAPGQSRRYVTYYGLGDAAADYSAPSSLGGYAPFTLKVNAGDDPTTPDTVETFYLSDQQGRSAFPVSAYIDNFSSSPILNASVRISLPAGLELDPATQPRARSLGTVNRNDFVGATWTVRATAARPGAAVIQFTGPGGKTVKFTMNIPAMPILNPLNSPSGLEMVSIPFQFTNNDSEHVFQSLGPLNPGGNATLIRWSPSELQYKWFPDTGTTNINPGEGFWLLNRNRLVINLPSDAVALPTDAGFTFAISKGWNQIGDPFTAPVRFDRVTVIDAIVGELTMQDAMAQGLLVPTLFSYNPTSNQYEWQADLSQVRADPYTGYWLFANRDLTLNFPPPTAFTPSRFVSSAQGVPPAATGPDNWQVKLSVSAAGRTCANRAFGVKAAGIAGLRDVPSPPTVQYGTMLNADFHKDASTDTKPYLVDCRSVGGAQTWHLTVDTNAANQDVTVSWPDLSQLPRDLVATLEDVTTGQRRYMRTAASYSYSSGATPGKRAFNIIVQPRQGAEAAITNLTTAQAGGAAIEFVYALSAQANTDILVRNISGLPIKHLLTDSLRGQGTNTASWNCQSDGGSPVPPGRYLVQVTARSPETGMQSSVVRPFQVSR